MYLTVKDLAQQLQVKPSTVYAWAARGKLPSLKINGVVRFDSEAIARWLESCQGRSPTRAPRSRDTGRIMEVDRLVERAKRAVYTPPHGEPRPDRAPGRKEGQHGAQ